MCVFSCGGGLPMAKDETMNATLSETTVTLHPFEASGLGQAPFRFVSLTRSVFVAAPGCPEQPGSSCDYCGKGIMNVCNIADRNGRECKVGIDCVRKLNRADNRLVSDANRAEALREKAIRDERAAANRQERIRANNERVAAAIKEQRERNGGLTDAEVAAREQAAKVAKVSAENEWLLTVIRGMYGDFCLSMCERLQESAVSDLPERCVDILREIYGKSRGRRGSKAYEAAAVEFDALAGIVDA